MTGPGPGGELLGSLLRDVSRSFYLTLRVLPTKIRRQIGLAYLLARTTDTVADTRLVAWEQRIQALGALRERILGEHTRPLAFGILARNQGTPAEKILLERVEETLRLLQEMDAADLARVRQVLETIISGQELDLERFREASPTHIIALESELELDDYTYRVAGCVGEFWTCMCRAHLFPDARLDEAELVRKGVRFGKGLQLVNILRDFPQDLREGRCYLPGQAIKNCWLKPGDLLDPSNEAKFRPAYNTFLERAEAHLRAGWDYTNSLPPGNARVRLACAWPILIGMETIRRLRRENVLETRRIKVPRSEVRSIMLKSVVVYPFPRVWQRQIDREG